MYAIDVHAHVFPDNIADKAVALLAGEASYPARGTGTMSDLEQRMDASGVRASVLLAVATRVDQVRSINNWIKKRESPRFIPFAALHPADPQLYEEIERVRALGFKGVKLHPNYQEFYPDEPRVLDMARALRDAGMILFLHAGADLAFEDVPGSPERIARLIEAVPDLKLVLAHFGGFKTWDAVEHLLAGSNAWFDISFIFGWIDPEQFRRIARKHGVNRILFGTDYPWLDPSEQITALKEQGFTSGELEAILHKNAEALLGLAPVE